MVRLYAIYNQKVTTWDFLSQRLHTALSLFFHSSGPLSSCLNDNPAYNNVSADNHKKLPGQLFDGDEQCKLQYGDAHKHCAQKQVTLYSLRNFRRGTCAAYMQANEACGFYLRGMCRAGAPLRLTVLIT